MRYLKTIKQVLAAVAEPLRRNCTFAVFMYRVVPRCLCAHADTHPLTAQGDDMGAWLLLRCAIRHGSGGCLLLREVSVDTDPDDAATRR